MNDIYVGSLFSEDYLSHHGILGMRWGVRRYQNEDGTLTPAGKKRKEKDDRKKNAARNEYIAVTKSYEKNIKNQLGNYEKSFKKAEKVYEDVKKRDEYKKLAKLKEKRPKDYWKSDDYDPDWDPDEDFKNLKKEREQNIREVEMVVNHLQGKRKAMNSVDVNKYNSKEYRKEVQKVLKQFDEEARRNNKDLDKVLKKHRVIGV